MIPVNLMGGVDQMTVKTVARPGTLRDCLNFEVAARDGYSRIAGIARFDGKPGVANYKLWRLRFVTVAGTWVAGNAVQFTALQVGYILDVVTTATETILYAMFSESAESPTIPGTLTNNTTAATATISRRDVIFKGRYGLQSTFDTALAALYTTERAKIGQVPGREGSDIIGAFWFKDRLYAIRDLFRLSFTGGYYTDANEGQYVTYEGNTYQILNVIQTGLLAGVLTLDPVTGSGVAAVPLTAATLSTLGISGSLGDAYLGLSYTDGLTAAGVPPYTWVLSGGGGGGADPISAPDLSAINFLPQITDAALYRSSPTGWERVALGREIAFQNGTSDLANFNRSLTMEGAATVSLLSVYPTASLFNSVSNNNINSDNGTEVALTGAQGDEYVAQGFDLTSIPLNAIIRGIEVTVERHSNTANQATDALVDLLIQNGGTENKSKADPWPNAIAATVYGGASDLWGSQTITPADLQNVDFGVRVIVKRTVSGTATIGGVDYIRLSVWYTLQDVPVYFYNGTSDVEATLRHVQITSGDTTTGDADGYLALDGEKNADKPRLVGVGEQIRTGALGTGLLLGYVAARDKPIWLAGQAEIDNNRSRYMFHITNFYGRDEYEAVYGVCGASRAFVFDGIRCHRVYTELSAKDDLPRHIVRHGDSLGLGYFPGAVLLSAPGDPTEMRGANGATAIEFGDRLVSLRPMNGDAMAVICQSGTYLLRGTTVDSYFKSPITTKRGGIEYTDADLGRVVLCDGLGLFAADSAEQFGAATRNYLSIPVLPWLQPRLQATLNSEQATIRPIVALEVRAKNQYRLYFWDGSVLTMTNTEPPQFTFQRMYEPTDTIHDEPTPWPVRAVASGIDSSGRERLFCSFYGGVKEGYVFEMDSGRSFDSAAIPAFIELNPFHAGDPTRIKRADRSTVFGFGGGRATLSISRAINYGSPDTSKSQSMSMGPIAGMACYEPEPFRGGFDFPVEGEDITWRFDSSTATEAPFTLQAVVHEIDDRGQSRGAGSGR